MSDLTLSEEELKKITGYRRAALQMKMLASFGIPAQRRADNTVLVFRMHCVQPSVSAQTKPRPTLK